MVNGRRLTRPANSVQAAVFELFARTAGAGVVAPIPARRFNPSSRRLAAKFSGKWRVDIREVVNGVMYLLSTGCQWRALPKELPPRRTVHDYLSLWNRDGTLDRIHHVLYVECREKAAREASPTACIIDSQSVKSA